MPLNIESFSMENPGPFKTTGVIDCRFFNYCYCNFCTLWRQKNKGWKLMSQFNKIMITVFVLQMKLNGTVLNCIDGNHSVKKNSLQGNDNIKGLKSNTNTWPCISWKWQFTTDFSSHTQSKTVPWDQGHHLLSCCRFAPATLPESSQ